MSPPAIKKESSRSKGRKEEEKMKKRKTSSSSSSSSSERMTVKKTTKASKRKMERKTEKERGVLALENLADSMEGLVSNVTNVKLVIKLMMDMMIQIQTVMLTIKVMWTGLSVAVGAAITVFFAFNNK